MNNARKKICIVTATRSEYGLLRPLIQQIQNSPDLSLQLVVTGSHLSPEFGLTYKDIINDGFKIDKKVEILLSSDSKIAATKSVGLGIISLSEIFSDINPDLIVILGDRYELLAIAIPAILLGIPIAHIHGGELTQGVFDEQVRHAITKIAHIHFTSTEIYKRRIIQMGENPAYVFNVGALGYDNIASLKLLNKKEFSRKTSYVFGKLNFLLSFHPCENDPLPIHKQCEEIIKGINNFPEAHVLVTQASPDPNGRIITDFLKNYASQNLKRVFFVQHLGQINYLSALKNFDLLIGNSSSGIIEMPYFRKPTINIGMRQDGRVKPSSVIDCSSSSKSITDAIHKALSKTFQQNLKNVKNPYGKSGAAKKITTILSSIDFREVSLKKFYDIKFKI